VVHSHNTCAFIFGTLGARLAGVRTIVHTDHARAFPDRFRYMAAEYLLSHLVYRVVGVSAPTSEALHRYERIPRRKLVTVPNGIDRSRYTVALDRGQVRRALGIAPEAPVIALAARLTEQKGLQYLLRALPAVIVRHPDVVLLVAGDGPLRPALEALAAELGVAPHVRFLGMRDDIAALLRASDVYALPSVWEGLPMAVLEAMAAGLPVVGSDVGGVGTAVEHQVTGLLVPKRDPARLAEALVAVLGDRVLRRRLGDEARRVFERRFTAEAMARAYEALYLRAPAGGSGA
jgi:glycosyltransferase involved in cell wall biosynthesis